MTINRLCCPILWLFLIYLFINSGVNSSTIHQNRRINEDYLTYEEREAIKIRRALITNDSEFSGGLCYGYQGIKGKCLPITDCEIEPIKENYMKYKNYHCIIKGRNEVGVCCPNKKDFQKKYLKKNFKFNIKNTHRNKRSSTSENNIPESIKAEINTCGRNGEQLSEKLTSITWPWVVSLKVASTLTHFCGATLISRYHILTAAHCFVYKEGIAKKESVIARLGEYDFSKNNTIKTYSDYKLADLIYHEDYDLYTFENDIALLILETPAKYSIYVQPICMPKVEKYENRMATVTGWGHIKTGGPGSQVLRQIEVPVWEFASCKDSIAQTVFTTNICAGDINGVKDACQADSGGPLMMSRNSGKEKRWELVGIVSWGIKCAEKGKPGIYTQVNKYFDWIYDKINTN